MAFTARNNIHSWSCPEKTLENLEEDISLQLHITFSDHKTH